MNTIIKADVKDYNKIVYDLIEKGGYLCSKNEYQRLCKIVNKTKNLDAVLSAIGAVTVDKRSFLITEKIVSQNESIPITTVIKIYKNRGKTMDINSVNIEERKNDRCRNQHMPKRYWKHLTEI